MRSMLGPSSRARALSGLVLLTLVLSICLALPTGGSSWTLISPEVSYRITLYDGNLDGVPELLAVDGFLYTNLTARVATDASPYKADLNAPGILCLALYRALDGYLAAMCPYGYYTYAVPANATLRVHRHGLTVCNVTHAIALVGGKAYSSPVDGVPVLINGRPALVGSRGGYLILYYLDVGLEERVAPLNVTIVEALYDGGIVFGVGLAGTTAILFRYDTSARALAFRPLAIGALA